MLCQYQTLTCVGHCDIPLIRNVDGTNTCVHSIVSFLDYVYVSDIDTTQTCVITFNNVNFSNCYRYQRVSVVFMSISVASTLLIEGVSRCSTRVSIRHMWLHWIMSLCHIIIGVDVSLYVSFPVSVSLCFTGVYVNVSLVVWMVLSLVYPF